MDPYWLFLKTVVNTMMSLFGAAAVLFTAAPGPDVEVPRRAAVVRASFATASVAPMAVEEARPQESAPAARSDARSMAVDALDSCGVYFGTTGGQVYGSANGGDTWAPIVRDLPPVLSVEVQTLP